VLLAPSLFSFFLKLCLPHHPPSPSLQHQGSLPPSSADATSITERD